MLFLLKSLERLDSRDQSVELLAEEYEERSAFDPLQMDEMLSRMQTDLFEVAKQERDNCIAHVYDWQDFTPSLNNGASRSLPKVSKEPFHLIFTRRFD